MSSPIARLVQCYLLVFACFGATRAAAARGAAGHAPRTQARASERTTELLRRAAVAASPRDFRANLLVEPRRSPALVQIQDRIVSQGVPAVPMLLRLLADSDLRVSEAAAEVLQRIRDPKAQQAVIFYSLRHLLDEPRKTKRIEGPGYDRLMAIGAAALPAVTTEYDRRAPSHDINYLATLVRVAAAMPERAGLLVVKRALRHPCSSVAATAAGALSALEGRAALPRLVEFLADRPTGCVEGPGGHGGYGRCSAGVHALARLNTADAVEPLLDLIVRLPEETEEARFHRLAYSGRSNCRQEAIAAIDRLAGVEMKGDIPRIRAWVESYKHR